MDPRVEKWLERDPDPETRAALERLVSEGDEAAIEARFSGRLRFGTAGLRGVVGVGPARMNRLVVCETSMGLGAHLADQVDDAHERGVVVGYDARPDSRRFAEDVAAVLTAQGFRVHLFDREVATPICAYTVVAREAAAGVVVTASHNPPEYNGYKVYWENGAQIIPPHDRGIAAAIEASLTQPLPELGIEAARATGRLEVLGDAAVEAYLSAVLERGVKSSVGAETRAGLAIAYTPLHGVGAAYAEALLGRAGYTGFKTVAEQREPDGSFPTVRFPNPEEPGAMDAVVALARERGAALAVANDPDADRLAVAARTPEGDYEMLSGNQIGALLGADAIRAEGSEAGACVATTVVSSRLLKRIAESAGVGYFETLTGFKWIANGALSRMEEGARFLFGYEEALGYMVGTQVRDKDGLSAMLAFAEMASELSERGETVLDALDALYREHGAVRTDLRSIRLAPGTPGSTVTDALREAAPRAIGAHAVEAITDLRRGSRVELASGERTSVEGIPESDVLIYELSEGARVVVRPSGTEPKVKCYYELREAIAEGEDVAVAVARAEAQLAALVEAHQAELPAA